MNIRVLIILSLFVGIGAVLHAIAPPLLFGMKPDMSLAMMFLGIISFPRIQYVLLVSTVTGFVAALTTTFPMGQIPNIVEKALAGLAFFGLLILLNKVMSQHITTPIVTALGTIISGSLFLSIALFIIGVDIGAGFIALFMTVVLPATVVNTIAMIVIYPIAIGIMKRTEPIPLS